MQHHRLATVEHEPVAGTRRRGRDARQVMASAGLPVRWDGDPLAGRHRGEQLLLLRRRAQVADQRRRQDGAGKVRLEQQPAAERVHGQHGLHVRAAHAAVFLRHLQPEQAQLRQLGPDLPAPAFLRVECRLARGKRILLADEALHGVVQELLLLGEVEVHFRAPSRRRGAVLS